MVFDFNHIFPDGSEPSVCAWNITANSSSQVVQLTSVDVTGFGAQPCDDVNDYMMINDQRFSICPNSNQNFIGSELPYWSLGHVLQVYMYKLLTKNLSLSVSVFHISFLS